MSGFQSLEPVLQRFLENRENLTDQEFSSLIETLRTQPALAELLKEHLLMDELLAQQYQMDRKDFVGKFEQRLRDENGQAHVANPTSSHETYALRLPDSPKTNGELTRRPTNGSSGQSHLTGVAPKPELPDTQAVHSLAEGTSPHPWRTLLAVLFGLLLVAGGLLRLEYTDAARKIGELTEVSGMAYIYRGDVGTVAAMGMPILPGDEIRVPEDAKVSLKFRDQSEITLAANSRVRFQPGQDHWPGIVASGLSREVSLSEGVLEARIEPQPADRAMLIHTPEFQAKVLGTRLILTVKENQSRLEVLEGLVEVQSKRPEDPPLEIAEGYQLMANQEGLHNSPGEWPISKEGLVFLLSPEASVSRTANQGVQLFAEGPSQTPSILRPRKETQFEAGQMVFRGGAFLVEDSTASSLLASCLSTNELTLEATFQTDNLSQTGPAKWISFSMNPDEGNFALAQEGNACIFRLLTSSAEQPETFHEIPLFEIPDDLPHHVVVTYSPGEFHCYLDGKSIELTANIHGTFAAWKPQHFLFGDEWTGEREWQGQLAGVAVYHRALSAQEAARNALHFRLRFPRGSTGADTDPE